MTKKYNKRKNQLHIGGVGSHKDRKKTEKIAKQAMRSSVLAEFDAILENPVSTPEQIIITAHEANLKLGQAYSNIIYQKMDQRLKKLGIDSEGIYADNVAGDKLILDTEDETQQKLIDEVMILKKNEEDQEDLLKLQKINQNDVSEIDFNNLKMILQKVVENKRDNDKNDIEAGNIKLKNVVSYLVENAKNKKKDDENREIEFAKLLAEEVASEAIKKDQENKRLQILDEEKHAKIKIGIQQAEIAEQLRLEKEKIDNAAAAAAAIQQAEELKRIEYITNKTNKAIQMASLSKLKKKQSEKDELEKDAWWNQPDTEGDPYTQKQITWINDFIKCLKKYLSLNGMTSNMITKLDFKLNADGVRVKERFSSVIIYFDQSAIGLNDDIGDLDKAHITLFGMIRNKNRQIDGAGSHITLYLKRNPSPPNYESSATKAQGENIVRYGLYRDGEHLGAAIAAGYTLDGITSIKVNEHWPSYWSDLIMKGVNNCIINLKPTLGVPWGGSKTQKQRKIKNQK